MCRRNYYVFSYVCLFLYVTQKCISEPMYPPQLVLYTPGDPEYTEVVVKRVGDKLTLVCELRGDNSLNSYVWNYLPDNVTADRNYTIEPEEGPSSSSTLTKYDLQLSDSGRYMCSAPPFSLTKYILVQTRGPVQCARGAFWCGSRCVLAAYVCDGFPDCRRGEDERAALCRAAPCGRADRLNCSSGRCVPAAACCGGATPLCRQPACCDEHWPRAPLEPPDRAPPLRDDRRPDDYGFIQSTIYTVTACALIFMLAVVLLVSAICKMHMKRAALRQYTQPEHYVTHQSHRFPPCYEASRLLEGGGSPPRSPSPPSPPAPPAAPSAAPPPLSHRGLARLSSIFSTRYRQVPSRPMEVEMTSVVSRYRRCGADGSPICPGGTGADGTGADGRPDTPTVAGADIDFLDTYTLNGRTIRLLGAEFPPAPVAYRPPPYKMSVYGPPPHYLSRDTLQPADSPATDDGELPPRYDELTDNITGNLTLTLTLPYRHDNGYIPNGNNVDNELSTNTTNHDSNTANGSEVTNDNDGGNGNDLTNTEITIVTGNNTETSENGPENRNGEFLNGYNAPPIVTDATVRDNDNNGNLTSSNNDIVESLSSVIDNLPAIDSDVNANDSNDVGCNA